MTIYICKIRNTDNTYKIGFSTNNDFKNNTFCILSCHAGGIMSVSLLKYHMIISNIYKYRNNDFCLTERTIVNTKLSDEICVLFTSKYHIVFCKNHYSCNNKLKKFMI